MKVRHLPQGSEIRLWALLMILLIGIVFTCLLTITTIPDNKLRIRHDYMRSKGSGIIFTNRLKDNDPFMLEYIWKQHIKPPPFYQEPYNLQPMTSLQQNNASRIYLEELYWINKLNINEGVFVEAGAHDGLYSSHSLHLEMDKNWQGVLIEPFPEYLAMLRSRNRRAWIADLCLLDGHPKRAEFSGTEYPFPWMTQRKGKHTKIKILSRKDLLRRLEESSMDGIIECFPLQSVLWTLGISQIDLLVLDIDGHEFAVLKDFPFDLVSVKILSLEHDRIPETKLHMRGFLESKGFQLVYEDSRNYLLINSSHMKM